MVIFFFFIFAPSAEARRGVGFVCGSWTSKNYIIDLDQIIDTEQKNLKIGFCYQYNHIFFVNVTAKNGNYCLYSQGDSYIRLSDSEAAMILGVSVDELPKPFLYRYPLLWVILSIILGIPILGAIFFIIQARFFNKKEESKA